MDIKLAFVIKFVIDMEKSVKFYSDILALPVKYKSDKWTEFDTGGTILALHLTVDEKIAGTVQLGFGTGDIDTLYSDMKSKSVIFTQPPITTHNMKLAEFIDSDGAACSLSG